MRRALGPILAFVSALAATVTAAAGGAPIPLHERLSGPDAPAVSAPARAGTPAAARRALSAAELRDRIAASMADAGGSSGVWVYDLGAGGGLLYSENASSERIPASNEKLLTTSAFLHEMGAEATLETRVYSRGKLGGPRDSVLTGDVVIRGDGDPSFGTARFARRADQPATRVANLAGDIARAGIEEIRGEILADDTIFDRERRAGPYLSPLSGLSFNDGYDADGEYARAPELLAAEGLKNALRKRGVTVSGKVGRANLTESEEDEEPIASVDSPDVATLIEETNVPSNNFFAEMLLKRLAATTGKRGTRDRGAQLVEKYADEVGTVVNASDGSGLSRKNRVSPEHLGRLLVEVADDAQEGSVLRDSLPVAGREGTLADRMRGTAAEGNCAAKTGTLNEVTALSGYCDAGTRTLAFSILMNDVNVDAGRDAQDEIAAALARYRP